MASGQKAEGGEVGRASRPLWHGHPARALLRLVLVFGRPLFPRGKTGLRAAGVGRSRHRSCKKIPLQRRSLTAALVVSSRSALRERRYRSCVRFFHSFAAGRTPALQASRSCRQEMPKGSSFCLAQLLPASHFLLLLSSGRISFPKLGRSRNSKEFCASAPAKGGPPISG